MSDQPKRQHTLRAIELEVEAEGREWMRRRLEAKLQKEADRESAVFPPQPPKGSPSAPKGAGANHGRRPG
jgi:hypothetical protein